jgi:hypothetical protein
MLVSKEERPKVKNLCQQKLKKGNPGKIKERRGKVQRQE